MSLGIIIANIAGSLREPPAAAVGATVGATAGATAGATTGITENGPDGANAETAGAKASALPVISASQPQFTPDFTVVVLQLLNEQGVVTSTIPSTQQLAAYRAGTAVPPGWT